MAKTKAELIIDVSEHDNPFDKALMEFMKIYHSDDICLDELFEVIEIHGLSVNETAALFAHLHWQIENDTVTITVEGEIKTLNDYILIRGNRKNGEV